MAARISMRALSKMMNASKTKCCKIAQQSLKNNASISKGKLGIFIDSSVNTSGTRMLSSSAMQNFMKNAGSKSFYKFKMSEMQRCVASLSLVAGDVTPGLLAGSSDSDLMEGSEDGDDVCSQGKQHKKRTLTLND